MPEDFPVTELWKILTGMEQARENETEVTIFDSVGFAMADFSALRYINDVALRRDAGVIIDLVPSLSDPKDLYSLLLPVALPAMPMLKEAVAAGR